MEAQAVETRCVSCNDVESIAALWNSARDPQKPWWWADSTGSARLSTDGIVQMAHKPGALWENSLVAVSHDATVGFAWGSVTAQERCQQPCEVAELMGIAVDPTYRRRGIGSRLLEAIESRARAQGRTEMRVIPPVLTGTSEYSMLCACGYRPEGSEVVLELDLAALRPTDEPMRQRRDLELDGLVFRDYEQGDYHALADLVRETEPVWWPRYSRDIRSGAMDSLLLAWHGARAVASMEVKLWETCSRLRTGGGPLVHPDYRRRGIATVLMSMWIRRVRVLGASCSVISTGSGPGNPARPLYSRLGYQQVGILCEGLAKDLKPWDRRTGHSRPSM
jgi:ribosomal protein S18 acetylase RimI-like enzyme